MHIFLSDNFKDLSSNWPSTVLGYYTYAYISMYHIPLMVAIVKKVLYHLATLQLLSDIYY